MVLLEFQAAKLEVVSLAVCHIVCSYVIWNLDLGISIRLSATGILLWHSAFQGYRSLLLLKSSITSLRLHADGRALLFTRNGEISAHLVAVPCGSSLLTILEFQKIQPVRAEITRRFSFCSRVTVSAVAGGVPVYQRKQLARLLRYGENS